MAKQYEKSPIVEALCEFQFIPTQPWDLTIPGLIYGRINKDFPQKQQQVGIGIQFKPTEKGIEHKIESAPPRMQFFNQDKTMLVQVGPDLLTVNHLRPYSTWATFKPIILEHLDIYKNIAKPKGFRKIGLRYINKINIKTASIKLEDYFKFYPNGPTEIPQTHTNFLSRIEIPYEDDRDHMLVTIGSTAPEEAGVLSIVLDLDYILSKPERIALDGAEEWLDRAHASIETVFENCIKDKTRILFGKTKK